MRKKILTAGAVFLLLILLVLGTVVTLLNSESFQKAMLANLTETLSRDFQTELTLEEVDFNVFRGFSLRKIRVVHHGDAAKVRLTCDEAVLSYKFFPLLVGKFQVGAVALKQPVIDAQVFLDQGASSKPSALPEPPTSQQSIHPLAFLAFFDHDLAVDAVTIAGGRLNYQVQGQGMSAVGEVEPLELSAQGSIGWEGLDLAVSLKLGIQGEGGSEQATLQLGGNDFELGAGVDLAFQVSAEREKL